MTHPASLSPRTEKWIRLSAIACMLLVAISAVVLSFDGLWNLAVENRVPEHLAFLFPIIIDGTITMSSLAILRMNLGGRKATFGWCVMFLGVALSIAGNAISVADSGVIAMLVHALPPLLLAISLELLLSLIRANIKAARAEAEQQSEQPKSQPSEQVEDQGAKQAPEVTEERPQDAAAPSNAIEENAGGRASLPVDVVGPQLTAAARNKRDSLGSSDHIRVPEMPQDVVAPSADPAGPNETEAASSSPEPTFATDEEELAEESPAIDARDTESDDQLDEQGEEQSEEQSEEQDPEGELGSSADIDLEPADATQERVEAYRKVVAGHPEWSRRKKILAIMVAFPEAEKDVSNIKRALGDKLNVSYREDLVVVRSTLEKRNRKN